MRKMNNSLRVLAVILLAAVVFSGCSLIQGDKRLTTTVVEGESMMPTLYDGQQIKVQRTKNVTYGDIVIFEFEKNVYHVKRIIAIPGDTIRFEWVSASGGFYNIFLNEELLEDYVAELTRTPHGLAGQSFTAQNNEYYVMGDNRALSNDSRHYGFINRSQIYGKVVNLG